MKNDKDPVKWLKEVIRINTVHGNEAPMAGYIKELLDKEGIDNQFIVYDTGRTNLVATLEGQPGDKVLGFTGNMDVVPADPAEWEYDPFGAGEADGLIFGRGASDNKSGVMAAVAALISLKRSATPFKGKVKLLLTVGKEEGLLGSKQLTAAGQADELTALVTTYPTNNILFSAHKGALQLRFTTIGKAAHGSSPAEGINALNHMRYFLDKLEAGTDLSSCFSPILGRANARVNVMSAGEATNIVPDECTAGVYINTVPGMDTAVLERKIAAIAEEVAQEISNFRLETEIISDDAAVTTPLNDPFVLDAIRAAGYVVSPVSIVGVTDASAFRKAGNFPVVIIGPGNILQSHQVNENIPVELYLKGISVYEKIVINYLK